MVERRKPRFRLDTRPPKNLAATPERRSISVQVRPLRRFSAWTQSRTSVGMVSLLTWFRSVVTILLRSPSTWH